MATVVIDLPEKFALQIPYRVLYSDVNSANHLGADRVLPIALEGQLQFIKHLGYSDATVFEDAGLIMVNAETRYFSEAFYADELVVRIAPQNFTSKSFELIYSIYNQTRESEMARVRTTMLFFDYDISKVIEVPAGFLQRIEKLEGCL